MPTVPWSAAVVPAHQPRRPLLSHGPHPPISTTTRLSPPQRTLLTSARRRTYKLAHHHPSWNILLSKIFRNATATPSTLTECPTLLSGRSATWLRYVKKSFLLLLNILAPSFSIPPIQPFPPTGMPSVRGGSQWLAKSTQLSSTLNFLRLPRSRHHPPRHRTHLSSRFQISSRVASTQTCAATMRGLSS